VPVSACYEAAAAPLCKNYADADSLIAVIVAQAMNHGHHVMARTSDIPFHVLETMYEQYLRLASLLTAKECITDTVKELPIFPLYSFDPETLYGAVDGQKFGVERQTVKPGIRVNISAAVKVW